MTIITTPETDLEALCHAEADYLITHFGEVWTGLCTIQYDLNGVWSCEEINLRLSRESAVYTVRLALASGRTVVARHRLV